MVYSNKFNNRTAHPYNNNTNSINNKGLNNYRLSLYCNF